MLIYQAIQMSQIASLYKQIQCPNVLIKKISSMISNNLTLLVTRLAISHIMILQNIWDRCNYTYYIIMRLLIMKNMEPIQQYASQESIGNSLICSSPISLEIGFNHIGQLMILTFYSQAVQPKEIITSFNLVKIIHLHGINGLNYISLQALKYILSKI